MNEPQLNLIRATRQSASMGRDALIRQGVVASLAAHTIVVTLVYVVGLLNLGELLDPVLPYPPRHDYAAISVPFSQSMDEAETRANQFEYMPVASNTKTIDELVPTDTTLARPESREGDVAAVVVRSDTATWEPHGRPAEAPSIDRPPQARPSDLLVDEPIERSADRPSAAGALSRATAGVETTVPPRVLINVAPSYPRDALLERRSGTVVLRVEVAADGRVLAVRIDTSSGVASLDASALEAVRQWKFLPARDANASPRAVKVPIEFVIRPRATG